MGKNMFVLFKIYDAEDRAAGAADSYGRREVPVFWKALNICNMPATDRPID